MTKLELIAILTEESKDKYNIENKVYDALLAYIDDDDITLAFANQCWTPELEKRQNEIKKQRASYKLKE